MSAELLVSPLDQAAMLILETDRLSLRELTIEDAPFMLRLLNEPSFMRYIGDRGVRSIEAAERYLLQGPIESYQRHSYGLYGVRLKGEAELLGICGLVKRSFLDDADIGFAFLPEHWSKGYAVEAARAVVDQARNVLGLRRLLAITSSDNAASAKLLEKIGLRFERMLLLPQSDERVKVYSRELAPSKDS